MPKTRETEDRDEQVEDKVEDRDKEKTEFSSDDRDSSFRGRQPAHREVHGRAAGVNGGGMLDQWGGVKLYHLVSMAGINVRATCSGKCPAGGLGSGRRAGRSW